MTDLNLLVYAYIGDSYYELLVRQYLIGKNIKKVKELKEESLKFVSAKSQAFILDNIKEFLTESEKDLIRRGRNVKTNSKPKNCDILTYKYATALEVLFGKLYLDKDFDRLEEIFKEIIKISGE